MDSEFEKQAERYVTQCFVDIAQDRQTVREAVESDLVKRGLLRSGAHVDELLHAWGGVLEKRLNVLLTDLTELVERHVGTDSRSGEWLPQRYVRFVEGLGRGLQQELEEVVTKRIRLPEVQQAVARDVEQLSGQLASRGRLRIETALGEATLSRAKLRVEDSSADLDEMVPPLLKKTVFDRDLKDEIAAATSAGYSLGLIMLDGDNFKSVNDQYGHDVGDEVIKGIGHVTSQAVLRRGKGYRFGGDEFVLLLPNHSPDEVSAFAEALRVRIEGSSFGTKALKLTATLGVACFPEDGTDAAGLLRAADQALLAAKKRGRNLVGRAAVTQPS